jgi:hypothetical protein
MKTLWGNFVFETASIIAGLIVAVVVIGYASDSVKDWPVIPIVPLIIAGAILLVGWSCREVSAER